MIVLHESSVRFDLQMRHTPFLFTIGWFILFAQSHLMLMKSTVIHALGGVLVWGLIVASPGALAQRLGAAQASAPSTSLARATKATISAPVSQFELENGLTVIVKQDHRAPTAVHMLWVRVGSMDEVDGASGVAHVLEHMMFKGTRKLKPGEFSRRVAAWVGAKTPSPQPTTPATTSKCLLRVWKT